MKSYEILQKDLEAEQIKRRDALNRAAKAEADLVVMSEACRQSAAHIRRVKADAVRSRREAERLAAELQLMSDAMDDLRAKLDASKAQHMDAQATVSTLTDHLAQERRQHDATKRSAQTAIDAVTEAAEAAAAKKRDEWREKMLLTKAAHADELKAIRSEASAHLRSKNDALDRLNEANKRLAAYGGAVVE